MPKDKRCYVVYGREGYGEGYVVAVWLDEDDAMRHAELAREEYLHITSEVDNIERIVNKYDNLNDNHCEDTTYFVNDWPIWEELPS